MIDDPNFLYINDSDLESPEELIAYYVEVLSVRDEMEETELAHFVTDMFNDISIWTTKNLLISQAKSKLAELQKVKEVEEALFMYFDDGADEQDD